MTDTTAHDFSTLSTVETRLVNVADDLSDGLANRAPLRHLPLQIVLGRDFPIDLGKLTPIIALNQELQLLYREALVCFVKCVTFVDG